MVAIQQCIPLCLLQTSCSTRARTVSQSSCLVATNQGWTHVKRRRLREATEGADKTVQPSRIRGQHSTYSQAHVETANVAHGHYYYALSSNRTLQMKPNTQLISALSVHSHFFPHYPQSPTPYKRVGIAAATFMRTPSRAKVLRYQRYVTVTTVSESSRDYIAKREWPAAAEGLRPASAS